MQQGKMLLEVGHQQKAPRHVECPQGTAVAVAVAAAADEADDE
jgi:hypothetical protein